MEAVGEKETKEKRGGREVRRRKSEKKKEAIKLACGEFIIAYLRQLAYMICVEQKLLQAPRISQDIVGDARQRAMTLVNVFHLPVTPFKNWNVAEHRIPFFTVDHVNAAPNIIVSCNRGDEGWIERARLLFAHIFQVRVRRRNAERNKRHNTHFHALLGFKTRSRLVLPNLTSSCPRITKRVVLLQTFSSIVAPRFGNFSNYINMATYPYSFKRYYERAIEICFRFYVVSHLQN